MMRLPGVIRQRCVSTSSEVDFGPARSSACSDGSGGMQTQASSRSLQGIDLSRDDFKVLELLGQGGFGEVKLVRCIHDNHLYAMKAVQKVLLHERKFVGDDRAPARAKVERDIGVAAREWQCPFIVELFASFQTIDKLYYIFEYCNGGELYSVMQAQPGACFSEASARFYAAEVVLALEHLHTNGVVHRDVRIENMLLASDGHVKLADFGCAKMDLPKSGSTRASHVFEFSNGRTEIFYPPEYIQGEEYGKDLDCWQLGVALVFMLAGELPRAFTPGDEASWPPSLPAGASGQASDLCRRLLALCRSQRLGHPEGASHLRQHDFFCKSAGADFLDKIASKAVPPPELAQPRRTRASRGSRWARPTVAGWTTDGLFRLSRFSFRASTLFRRNKGTSQGARSVRSHRSRISSTFSRFSGQMGKMSSSDSNDCPSN